MQGQPDSTPDRGPLDGLRIVECAGFIAGPYCGKLLAGLGAEVVKVEPPGGDPARCYGPFAGDIPDPEKSGLFLYLNTNKRGVVLDLGAPTGRKSLHRLLDGAGILIEDWRARDAELLGLGYEALHQRHPLLQVVSVTPYGRTGPYAGRPASDLTVFHASGMAFETPQGGVESLELPPLRPGGCSSSFLAGTVAAAAAITGALYQDGRGHHVDVSHLEALTSVMLRISFHQHTYEGKEPVRLRSTDRQVNYLPCKDGYVNAYLHQPNWWQGLVKAMGDPEWAHEPLFQGADFRTQAWDLLEPLLEAWAQDYTRRELFELLQRHHVPCLPGYTFEDVVKDPHLNARG
ncbi:MAG: CoA transferase, partial [Chloroflexota bacterium]